MKPYVNKLIIFISCFCISFAFASDIQKSSFGPELNKWELREAMNKPEVSIDFSSLELDESMIIQGVRGDQTVCVTAGADFLDFRIVDLTAGVYATPWVDSLFNVGVTGQTACQTLDTQAASTYYIYGYANSADSPYSTTLDGVAFTSGTAAGGYENWGQWTVEGAAPAGSACDVAADLWDSNSGQVSSNYWTKTTNDTGAQKVVQIQTCNAGGGYDDHRHILVDSCEQYDAWQAGTGTYNVFANNGGSSTAGNCATTTLVLEAGDTVVARHYTYYGTDLAAVSSSADPVAGCTDSSACNYNDTANVDDSSCDVPSSSACETCVDGASAVTLDADGDGVCDADEVSGCNVDGDCSFNSSATDLDATECSGVPSSDDCEVCDGGSDAVDAVYECVDIANEDGTAWLDSDGWSCGTYESAYNAGYNYCGYELSSTNCCICGGGNSTLISDAIPAAPDTPTVADADGDGVCDADEVVGCQDASACNYNAAATDAGECNVPAACDTCNDDGTVSADALLDGVCQTCGGEGALSAGSFALTISYVEGETQVESYALTASGDNWSLSNCANFEADGGATSLTFSADCDLSSNLWSGAVSLDLSVDDTTTGEGTISIAGSGLVASISGTVDEEASSGGTIAGNTDDATAALLTDNDQDDDSVCDADELVGCQDTSACDYNSAATDSGECTLPGACDSCSGETDGTGTLIDGDINDNSVCDIDEVDGCDGVLGSGAEIDDCGQCGGLNLSKDCAGTCSGDLSGGTFALTVDLDENGSAIDDTAQLDADASDQSWSLGSCANFVADGGGDAAIAFSADCSFDSNVYKGSVSVSLKLYDLTTGEGTVNVSKDGLLNFDLSGTVDDVNAFPNITGTLNGATSGGLVNDCAGNCDGTAFVGCSGECDSSVIDECGVCGGAGVDDNSCCDNGVAAVPDQTTTECVDTPDWDDGTGWSCANWETYYGGSYFATYGCQSWWAQYNEPCSNCCGLGGGTSTETVIPGSDAVLATGPNGEEQDCAGVCGGDATVSNCGVCEGLDNTPNAGTCDCEGTVDGTVFNDCVGDCGGDSFSLGEECVSQTGWTSTLGGYSCGVFASYGGACLGFMSSYNSADGVNVCDACCGAGGGATEEVCAYPAYDPISDLTAVAQDEGDPTVKLTWSDFNSDTVSGVTYELWIYEEDDSEGVCDSCVYNWDANGSACCDTAFSEYGLTCAALEGGYGWDCSGCACPGDVANWRDNIAPYDVRNPEASLGTAVIEPQNLFDVESVIDYNIDLPDITKEVEYSPEGYPIIDLNTIYANEMRGGWRSLASGLGSSHAAGTIVNVQYGNYYKFVVASTNNTGQESDWSNEAEVTASILDAPTGLVAVPNYDEETISLSWSYPGYEGNPYPNCTGNLDDLGDGYCDASTNVPECGYDGGDCCASTCDGTDASFDSCTACVDCGNQSDDGWDSCYDPDNGGSGMPTCNEDYRFGVVATDCYLYTSALKVTWNPGCDLQIYKDGALTTLGNLNPPVINYGFSENETVTYEARTCEDLNFLADGYDCATFVGAAASYGYADCSPYSSYVDGLGNTPNDACCGCNAGGGVQTVVGSQTQSTTSEDCDAGVENCAGGLNHSDNGICDDDLNNADCSYDFGDCDDGAEESCSYDFTASGSPTCDTAWTSFGLSCADLEANYNWDCNGCACPGDQPAGDDGGDDVCNDTVYSNGYSCEDLLDLGYDCQYAQATLGYDCRCSCDDCYDTISSGGLSCQDYLDAGQTCDTMIGAGFICCGCETWDDDVASSGSNELYKASSKELKASGSISSSDIYKSKEYSVGPTTSSSHRLTEGFKVFSVGVDDALTYLDLTSAGTTYKVENVKSGCFAVSAYDTSPIYESVISNIACVEPEQCPVDGDSNGDGNVNVADVVSLVNSILNSNGSTTGVECGDFDEDGAITVSDIVSVVNIILNGRDQADASNDASEAKLTIADNTISIKSDGLVQGIQLKLSHESDFSIELVDAYVSDYVTKGNITSIVIVTDGSADLTDIATFEGDNVKVESSYAVNSSASEVSIENVAVLADFELKLAGPNPFNPTTSLNVVVPEAGLVSVNVYNVLGQQVATLADGYMDASNTGHTLTWNAENLASGVYFVRANASGQVSTQKLMLLK